LSRPPESLAVKRVTEGSGVKVRKLVAVPKERFDEVAERVASRGDSEVFLCPDLVVLEVRGRRSRASLRELFGEAVVVLEESPLAG